MSTNLYEKKILDSTTYYNRLPVDTIKDLQKSIVELKENVQFLENRIRILELINEERQTFGD